MYKIAICDDDKRYRKTIREIIEHKNSLPENEIRFYEYESGNELLKHTDILHELVFIDIRMPGLDGNQTALKLRNYNKDAVLIFCSSYFEPTVDSINFGQPFRYIMKDLHDTSLRREIAAIMTEVKRRFLNDYAVTVTSAGKIIRIYVENILYVSRAKRGCEITIVKEQEKETVRCREAFGELYEQLKDQGFAQAHYVICNMYMGNEGHLLVMEFYNSYILPLIKEREHYISTKRNPEDHGIGLHTVGKLVEKYGGVMRIEAGEEEFSVKIVFTVK
jgi:DNA-binding LytR/AlgR family response regulator